MSQTEQELIEVQKIIEQRKQEAKDKQLFNKRVDELFKQCPQVKKKQKQKTLMAKIKELKEEWEI